MKKTSLLLSFCISVLAANAQLTLTGTSYTQNFNAQSISTPLATACPGWHVYIGATATALGTFDDHGSASTYTYDDHNLGADPYFGSYYDSVDCAPSMFAKGFKNSASSNVSSMATATCLAQKASSDRSLSVRQTGSTGWDPGPAFCLQLASTASMKDFSCSFKLQSLDETSARVTSWKVDYGFGATPASFTTATAVGTLTTGGYTWSNNTVTVNFGSLLDNMSSNVWIRITSQSASTGSGSRTTTGIDDFNLMWTNIPVSVTEVASQSALGLSVLGTATADKINMMYNAETAGIYNLVINDITGRTMHTETIDAVTGGQTLSVNGLHLASGIYIATMSNGNTKAVTRIAVQ